MTLHEALKLYTNELLKCPGCKYYTFLTEKEMIHHQLACKSFHVKFRMPGNDNPVFRFDFEDIMKMLHKVELFALMQSTVNDKKVVIGSDVVMQQNNYKEIVGEEVGYC